MVWAVGVLTGGIDAQLGHPAAELQRLGAVRGTPGDDE
jgi:hypothetical protein